MPDTTRLTIPYPSGSDANDFAGDMQALAEAADNKAVSYSSGTYAARPSATSDSGIYRIYNVTDNTANGGLFYSNGSSWIRLTASPWVSYGPGMAVTVINGSGATVSGVFYTAASRTAQYRILPNNVVEYYIDEQVSLSGSPQYVGLAYATPVPSARRTIAPAYAMGDVARCVISDIGTLGNVITIYPNGGYNGHGFQADPSQSIGYWFLDGASRPVLLTGTYPI